MKEYRQRLTQQKNTVCDEYNMNDLYKKATFVGVAMIGLIIGGTVLVERGCGKTAPEKPAVQKLDKPNFPYQVNKDKLRNLREKKNAERLKNKSL